MPYLVRRAGLPLASPVNCIPVVCGPNRIAIANLPQPTQWKQSLEKSECQNASQNLLSTYNSDFGKVFTHVGQSQNTNFDRGR